MVKRKTSGSRDSRDSLSKAEDYSYRLLGYRARSENELRERLLRKGFSLNIAEKVIGGLKEKGLIDDYETARSFIHTAIAKNLGLRGIKEYLIKRRIPEEIINEVIDMVDENESAEILTKKYLRRKGIKRPDIMTKNSLRNYLFRRGYGDDTIMNILKNLDTIMEET